MRQAKAAKTFPGSGPPARFAAAAYHETILDKRTLGLTAQRIWQDLTEEFGYGHSYESVKRYLRTIAPRGRPVGVFESEPGADYGEFGDMLSGLGRSRLTACLRSGKSGKFVRINNPVKFEFHALRFEVLNDPRD